MNFQLSQYHERLVACCATLAQERLAPRAAAVDREARFPRENFDDLRDANLLTLTIPAEFGGQGADLLTFARCLEELARGCGSTALAITMHWGNCLCARVLLAFPELRDQAAALYALIRDRHAVTG